MQFNELLKSASKEKILKELDTKLQNSKEAEIWTSKVIVYTSAILSILIPLREQNLLINPEGRVLKELNCDEFFRWCDMVSLKTLAFRIEASNEASMLTNSRYELCDAEKYKSIDLEELAHYLVTCKVDLEDIDKDFPIVQFNVHRGVTQLIKELMETKTN